MKDITEKSIRCNCIGGEHYLHFTGFEEDGNGTMKQLYVDLNAKNKPWGKRKWSMIWDIIRGKEICYDGIILGKEKSKEIIDFLIDFWNIKLPHSQSMRG